MSRSRARAALVIVVGAAVGCLAVLAAWALDGRSHAHTVLPRVVLAGKQVRGMNRTQLTAWVATVAGQFATDPVDVRTSAGTALQATVPALGVSVDRSRTIAEVMAQGRSGSIPSRIWAWARSFVHPASVPFAVHVDAATLRDYVAAHDTSRTAPVEPTIEVHDGHLVGVAGRNGKGIDPAQLAGALRRTPAAVGTLVVSMDVSALAPQYSEADADRVAADGENLAAAGMRVTAGGQTATIPSDSLRAWLQATPTDSGLQLGFRSDQAVLDGLAALLPNAGVKPVDASFVVNGGTPSMIPSKTGTACCDAGAIPALDAALATPAGRAAPVALPLKTVSPGLTDDAAAKLGIVEQVSTFTTPHNPGEPRNHNIDLMADTVRGTIIPPGGTFSLNGVVGQRTADKGYVDAPVIEGDYTYGTDIGGGVSQFSTTMFNASFFAGLDITEYFMHGLYISRYPYGREATLSWPSPDLKVHNTTPYGILVWPTYTDTSITVTLYSTRYLADVEQTNQTKVERPAKPPAGSAPGISVPGPCVAVTTERTRTYLDGHKTVDHFSGLYAPAEGWSCT